MLMCEEVSCSEAPRAAQWENGFDLELDRGRVFF